MRILIVSAYFPPQNSIASLRPYSWAKWWSQAGHRVTVVTTEKKRGSSDLNLNISGFEVISLPVPFSSRSTSYFQSNIMNKNNKKYNNLFLSVIRKWYSSFSQKTGCFYTCRFPDLHDLWTKNAIRKISARYFDLMITTGGPYSVHRVGLAIKQKNPLTKWIIDWRDLWTYNHLFKGMKIFLFYERYLENKFHRSADLITTVSEPLADTLSSITKTQVEVIFNGYDSDDYSEITKKDRKNNEVFTIIYTGTVYKEYQDPSSLFEAISNLKKNNIITTNNLKIMFAGTTDVREVAEYYQVPEFYSYLGFLSRENALQLQYDADVVLFLEYNNPSVPGILTGKLFEYIYISREIMAIGINETTSAGRLINDTRAGYCFGNDIMEIEKYLCSRVVDKIGNNLEKNKEYIQKFERKMQAKKILDIMKKYN